MRKGNLILTAIVAAAIGTGFYFKDNISSYFNRELQEYRKKQEIVIPYSESIFDNRNRITTDGVNDYYPYSLDEKPIAIEKSIQDKFTADIDSIVLEPTNIKLSSKNGPEIHIIKRKIIH